MTLSKPSAGMKLIAADLDLARRSGQWDAFNQVLGFINTLDTKTVEKKRVYAAVMDMRPGAPEGLLRAVNAALVAMKIASSLPGVADEYDFSPAIAECEQAIRSYPNPAGRAALESTR